LAGTSAATNPKRKGVLPLRGDRISQTREVSIIDNPYYFTGRHLDTETGLYYYRARYYSPDSVLFKRNHGRIDTMTTLHIRQDAPKRGRYPIRLTLKRAGEPDLEAEAKIRFALTEQEQEDLRWYLEDYLQRTEAVEPVTVRQIEALMKTRGDEL